MAEQPAGEPAQGGGDMRNPRRFQRPHRIGYQEPTQPWMQAITGMGELVRSIGRGVSIEQLQVIELREAEAYRERVAYRVGHLLGRAGAWLARVPGVSPTHRGLVWLTDAAVAGIWFLVTLPLRGMTAYEWLRDRVDEFCDGLAGR